MSKRFVYGVLLLAAAVLMYVLGLPAPPQSVTDAPQSEDRKDAAPVPAPATPAPAESGPLTGKVPPVAAQPNANTAPPPVVTTKPVMVDAETAEAPAPEE